MAGGSSDAPTADSPSRMTAEEETANATPGAAGEPDGYGDLVRGAAVYRDDSRRIFRIVGDRAPDMLQGLITADIRAPGEGAAWPTLILTPKGRVLADAVVVRLGDELLLDVPVAAWAGLEPHFGRYLPPRFAKLEPTKLRLARIRGPDAISRAIELMPELSSIPPARRDENEGVRWGAVAYEDGVAIGRGASGGTDREQLPGVDLLLPEVELDLPAASREAWEAWRIEQGIPVYGRDVSEGNLPQETGLVADTTSFSKGCYTGQEVLARIHYRGKVNRHLRGLRALGSSLGTGAESTPATPLAAGDELTDGDRGVGSVTSAVRSPRFGWIGLGYVRREIEPGDELTVVPVELDGDSDRRSGIRVGVEEVPFE